MRLSATRSLFERRDVIIVASVSCIYGLGSPEAYYGMLLPLEQGAADRPRADPAQAGRDPVRAQRPRLRPRHLPRARRRHRGLPVVRGDGAAHRAVRRRDRRARRRSTRSPARRCAGTSAVAIYPEVALRDAARRAARAPSRPSRRSSTSGRASARAGGQAARGAAAAPADDVRPRDDARDRLLPRHRELLAPPHRAAARASRRRRCSTTCRTTPSSIIDESHQTVPQVRGMYARRPLAQGSAGRLRLPPAVGARQPAARTSRSGRQRVGQVVYVSATPGPYELQKAGGVVVEQIIRPTGLIDPPIDVRPVKGQVDDLLAEIRDRAGRERARAGHHADQAHGRGPDAVLPRARRQGALPALRHRHARARRDPARPAQRRLRRAGRHQPAARGLDLPEVSLVAILDADKEASCARRAR